MARRMQRSREMQPVSDETVASYTAARAFLMGQWFGASMSVASMALLFLFTFAAPHVPAARALLVSLAFLAVGGFAYLRNRVYYERLDFPWAKGWHHAALIVAGTGAIFWLLAALLMLLAWRGVEILPS